MLMCNVPLRQKNVLSKLMTIKGLINDIIIQTDKLLKSNLLIHQDQNYIPYSISLSNECMRDYTRLTCDTV